MKLDAGMLESNRKEAEPCSLWRVFKEQNTGMEQRLLLRPQDTKSPFKKLLRTQRKDEFPLRWPWRHRYIFPNAGQTGCPALAAVGGLRRRQSSVTWKSCGLSDSSFLGAGVLLFLLLPGW